MEGRSLNQFEDASPLLSLNVPSVAGRSSGFSPDTARSRPSSLGFGFARAASAQDSDRFAPLPHHRTAHLSTLLSSLSPDPPARGPSDVASTAQRMLDASRRAPRVVGVMRPSGNPSRPRPRETRRPAPESVASAYAADTDEDPSPAPRPRRSIRSKRRAVAAAAASAANDSPADVDASPTPPRKRQKRGSLKRAPASLKDDSEDDVKVSSEITASCCICMDEPKPADLAKINACDHLFCFECIEKWGERENSCPLCKVRFSKIDRVNKAKKAGDKNKNSKRVKQRDQRSDLTQGAALEGLLASFASSGGPFGPNRVARLIFSGMHSGSFHLAGARSSERARAPRAPIGAGAFSSGDSSDEDDVSPFSLLRSMAPFRAGGAGVVFDSSSSPFGASMHVLRPMQYASVGLTRQSAPGRSYASNSNDQTAGRNSNNPLEIDDSDSDDDDIEVVQVRRA